VLRRFFAPIHPDGFKFVFAGAGATILLFLLWPRVGWVGVAVTLWLAYFFRDPWRVTPIRPGLLISPADGIVLTSGVAVPPRELEMGEDAVGRIAIFLNIFDVHVIRAPLSGRVAAVRYTKGRFLDAGREEASRHNERMAIRIVPPEGPDIAVVLIAGLLARRIVCDLREGQDVVAGQRIGIIRFGSRVDVYCSPSYVPMVIAGQRMVGGETVIGDRLAQEPARQGVAQ
jgi:phosphatidylserine decarboxylase